MSQPTVKTLEDAAQNAYTTGHSSTSDMSVLKDAAGNALTVTSANGCTGTAYLDTAGQVIIAFQGTSTSTQANLDAQILGGNSASSIAGLADALAFTSKVEAAAAARGISTGDISVTGHSLGGTLAEYVASKTGLAGASFAGSGVPDLVNPGASNFTSYVDSGDPYANFATDSGDKAVVSYTSSQLDHYGTVVDIGGSQGYAAIDSLVHNVQLLPLETLLGQGAKAEAVIEQQIVTDMSTYHSLATYFAGIATLSDGTVAASDGASALTSSAHTASLSDIAAAATSDVLSAFVSRAGLASTRANDQISAGSFKTVDVATNGTMHDGLALATFHGSLALLHTA